MARKTSARGFSPVSASGDLTEHELAERMRRILSGSRKGSAVTKAMTEFAHKHADEFKREMGIDIGPTGGRGENR